MFNKVISWIKSNKQTCMFYLIGVFVFIACICGLEYKSLGFYFTQDDVYSSGLMNVNYAYKSLILNHTFPEIDPHLWCGIPYATHGKTMVFFLPGYLSTFFSLLIFNDYTHTFEIYSVVNFFLAYTLTFLAARYYGIKNYLCTVFAICYTFSGVNLIMSNSWALSFFSAFLPLIPIFLKYLVKNKLNIWWAIIVGISFATLGFSGNGEFWVYSMIFFVLSSTSLFLFKYINWKKYIYSFFPFLLAFAITIPQNYFIWEALGPVKRDSFGAFLYFNHYFIYYFFPANNPNILYFSGGLFFLVVLFSLLALFKHKFSYAKKFFKLNPYLIVGIIAFLLSFSDSFGLYPLFHKLPLFRNFRWAIKFVFFTAFFLNFAGVIILSRMKLSSNKIFKTTVLTILLPLTFFLCLKCPPPFFKFSAKPYPSISKIEKAIPDIRESRILPITYWRSQTPSFPLLQKLDFPLFYELYSPLGYGDAQYETLFVENKFLADIYERLHINKDGTEDFYNIAKNYGVKYIFWDFKFRMPTAYEQKILEPVYHNDDFGILKISGYKPFAYIKDSVQPVPVKFTPNGAIVDISSIKKDADTKLIINLIKYKYYKAYIKDDNKKQYLPVNSDEYNRIEITLPKNLNGKELIVKYCPIWLPLISIASLMFIISLYLIILYTKKFKTD